MKSMVCNHEAARLEALYRYQILDTAPEQAFDDLVSLAAQTCNTPIALINLIDANRQWFKAKVGLDIEQLPRNVGFSSICIKSGEVLIISDTLTDERFTTEVVVTSEPFARFYAGVPLIVPGGEAIGTLCVLDHIPRQISQKQIEALLSISRIVVRQLESRRNLKELANLKKEYMQLKLAVNPSECTFCSLFDSAPMMGIIEDTSIQQNISCDRQLIEQQICEPTALLEITTDAVIVQDLANNILLWNKSAENIYGWKPEEAIGKNVNQLWYSKLLPQNLEIYNTVLQHNYWQGKLKKISKSGAVITVESHWKLLHHEHNQTKSILIVDTDISQIKELEKQFLRTQRIESIGTLTSGIAHDLNNVLSPILMSAQLLKGKFHEQNTQQFLSIVENNAKRGANLVKQVLSFVRGIEGDVSGRGTTNLNPVIQVKHLILEMQQIIQQTFPKSIVFTTEIQPDLLPVYGDSTQLYQVLMNLCLNARDAMPEGGYLTISTENIFIDENHRMMHFDAQVGNYIILTIADTGLGIKKEILDKIFEPFFTTKEFNQGTGLGLSTVRGIIKRHGGLITVSSCVGKGTKFQVYLPAVNTPITQSLENIEILSGCGEWILVIDDEAAIREVTTASLKNHNYKTISASDGIEAIALYTQHQDKISAAIIDIMMPNMDGAITIRTLQNINPQLPMIAVSGLVTSEHIAWNQASKYTAFLPKPYTVQELLKALHTILH
jgi:two-component system, cell cycle sensor histidine kinase and response regulator CckA